MQSTNTAPAQHMSAITITVTAVSCNCCQYGHVCMRDRERKQRMKKRGSGGHIFVFQGMSGIPSCRGRFKLKWQMNVSLQLSFSLKEIIYQCDTRQSLENKITG